MVQNTGDVRYLLILDNYTELPEIDLIEHWYTIYEQWSKIVGGSRSDLSIVKQRTAASMRLKFERQSCLYRCLKILPVLELVELFNEEGFKVDLEDFEKTMQSAYSRLMRNKAQIELNEKGNVKEESGDFEGVIVTLEKFQGYGFKERKMTVRKFANIYNKYKEDGKRRENNKK